MDLRVQVPNLTVAEFNWCGVQRVPNCVGAEFDQLVPTLPGAE